MANIRAKPGPKTMEKPVVLIVENEVLIRMGTAHMVADAGFSVVEAPNADAAIAILQSRSDIRAVFTDVRMSGSMDGIKLAHAIRGRWPPIHLIVTSGVDLPADAKLPENGRFIRKPYGTEEVAAALRELFGTDPDCDQFSTVSHLRSAKVA
jgi:CheY-like chemotaxis protein